MVSYLKRRLLTLLPVLAGVITLVFFIIHLIPGDPVAMMLGEKASPEQIEKVRHALGLDLPLWKQYVIFWKNVIQGNLGTSLYQGVPVWKAILERFPYTFVLAVSAQFLAIMLGIPLGIFSGLKKNTLLDHISRFLSVIGVSMPVFWLGPLLMIVFGIKFRWLPIAGGGTFRHMILPSVTLAFGMMTVIMRVMRASIIQVMNSDYIRMAYAKGIPKKRIIWVHALRNALLPVITVIGFQMGALLTGTVIVEYVFNYPGVGRLLIFAIIRRDYPVVQGGVLFIAMIYIGVNFITDVIYKFIDVRIRI